MRSNEFIIEATTPVIGMTLYHGTDKKNIIGIMKHGLMPRYNRWETKYGGDKKDSVKGVFVTPNLDDAKSFAGSGGYAGYGPSNQVVFGFTLLDSDVVEGEKFFGDELVIMNVITPDRLQIVWPASLAKTLEKKKMQAQASFDKTAIIKQINKLTRPYGAVCKSGSKTTTRVMAYFQDMQYYDTSVLLQDYPAYLLTKGIDPTVVKQVSGIIGV